MGLFDDLPDAEPSLGIPQITVYARPKIPQEGRALLDTIAGSESTGYDVLYGGGKFKDYADHPRQAIPIQSGPNVGKTTSAAGRYQFLGSTWDEVKKEAGLPDFSPESQDEGAWYLAQRNYKQKTGRDLTQDLQAAKENPALIKQIGSALSGTWTSLPGGIEPNRATQSFAQRYLQSGQPAGAAVSPANAPMGAAAPKSSGLFDDLPSAKPAAIGPERPDIGRGTALAAGAVSGATANFPDELFGAMEAAGLPSWVGKVPGGAAVELVAGLSKLGYEYLTGGDEAAKRYSAGRDKFRNIVKTAEEQYPGTTIAGNVGGAILAPGGALMQAATLPGRIGRGIAVGAGYGGLSGAGEGENIQDRITKGVAGAGVGGIVGGIAPPVVELGLQGARAATRPIANAVRGIVNPEGETARRVGVALGRDVAADPQAATRLTAPEFAANLQAGGPARVMDLGGETTRALARSAANTSPTGRANLNQVINERFEEQAPRVAGWLRNTFNYPNAQAQQEAIEQTAKIVNNARYGQAIKDGRSGIWDQELADLSQAPMVQDAIKAAIKQAQNRSAPDVAQGGAALTARWSGKNGPTLEFFDLVKRQIDQEINVAKRAGRNEDVMEATRIKNALVQKLDAAVPSYAQARAGAAHFFGAENALEAGQNFVGASARYGLPEARRALAQMTPQERQLFQDGYVSRLVEKIEGTGDRRNVLNQIAQSGPARDELQMALGPQRAAELEAVLRIEGIFDLARGAVQGNSTTARQIVELGLAGGVGGYGYLSSDPAAIMNAALVYGAARGHRAIDARVSDRVSRMLTSQDPRVLLRGVQMVARSNNIMNQLRKVDLGLARVGAQQTPRPALQIPATGRAEDQPEVPRPPGQ